MILWGSGSPLREFLYVDDLAEALIFLMLRYEEPRIINVGTGNEHTIRDLAELAKKTVGYEGEVVWDRTKPDGAPRKLLDVSRIGALGWRYTTGVAEGLKKTYAWYLDRLRAL